MKTLHSLAVLTLTGLSLGYLPLGQLVTAQAMPLTANAQSIASLRQQGPTGLQTFLKTHAKELSGKLPPAPLRAELDELCQQRDCYASRLYWYTDLEQAKAAAKASGKPILSLRLLGRLDQDLSCANSRFFRVALYPNAAVSKALRDRFILHWQSVRPVPKVTIDFGDGRKLERTITGNSIHYILDADGRPVDALPGLYGPQAFLRHLEQAEKVVKELQRQEAGQPKLAFLRQYHRDRLAALQNQWATDLKRTGITSVPTLTELPADPNRPPTAEEAGRLAMSKARPESPIVLALRSAASQNQRTLTEITNKDSWEKLAQLHKADAQLDQNSLALIQAKKFATRPAATEDSSLHSVVQNFEAAMALDTVRNEYLLHSQIHQWMLQEFPIGNVDVLNERVYAQLFLTPSSDPWLGLAPVDAYTAIDNDGVK